MGNNRELLDILRAYESPTTATSILESSPIVWERAKGAVVTDTEGNEYLDLSSGSGVANIGHSHNHVVQSIIDNVGKMMHTGWTYPSVSRIKLLDKIREILPSDLDQFIFTVTGSEGVEAALKLARYHTGKTQFAAFHGAYHGKTAGALGVTSRYNFKHKVSIPISVANYFHYPNCYRCPFRMSPDSCDMFCMDHMEETLKLPSGELDNIAGIIVEPVQGAEGMIVPPPGFYRRLREMADKLGVLLIFDEIFTGMGRTGEFFAFEHEGIVPDIVILGKALGGGLPITLVATRRDISKSFPPLRQTSTFSAHPLASSAALATLEVIENENIISSAQKMGDYLIEKLRKLQNNFPLIGQVRGRGMMIGVELVLDKDKSPASKEAKKFVDMAKEDGLILLSGGNLGNVLKITPPLNLTIEQADFVIEKIEKILIKLKEEVVSDESCIVG